MKQVGEGRVKACNLSSIKSTENFKYLLPLFLIVIMYRMTTICLFKVMGKGIDET